MTTFTDWLQDRLDAQQIRELAEHGADAGWPGLTYTGELVELYDRHEEELWEALAEDADDFGYDCVPAFVATFNRADMTSTADGFKELVVWYAAEREAQRLTDAAEAY